MKILNHKPKTMKNPKQKHTIASLRQSGWKVRCFRRDWVDDDIKRVDTFRLAEDEHPPVTQVDVTSPEGLNGTGYAYRVHGDNFNRKKGNLIALNRALCDLAENKG